MRMLGCMITALTITAMTGASGKDTSAGHSSSPHSGSVRKAQEGVDRDTRGRINRTGKKARHDFKHAHPCPANGKTSGACPGCVIDHIIPLKRGGADRPGNMQWQTKEAAKEKDKWE